jgi:hypothetical protein
LHARKALEPIPMRDNGMQMLFNSLLRNTRIGIAQSSERATNAIDSIDLHSEKAPDLESPSLISSRIEGIVSRS